MDDTGDTVIMATTVLMGLYCVYHSYSEYKTYSIGVF